METILLCRIVSAYDRLAKVISTHQSMDEAIEAYQSHVGTRRHNMVILIQQLSGMHTESDGTRWIIHREDSQLVT